MHKHALEQRLIKTAQNNMGMVHVRTATSLKRVHVIDDNVGLILFYVMAPAHLRRCAEAEATKLPRDPNQTPRKTEHPLERSNLGLTLRHPRQLVGFLAVVLLEHHPACERKP